MRQKEYNENFLLVLVRASEILWINLYDHDKMLRHLFLVKSALYHVDLKSRLRMWQNQPELYRLKYVSPFLRAPTCFKRYNPLACRVTSR
jgi:hypothetical protein